MKKILILNTGGTISSIQTKDGYAPALGYVKNALGKIPALSHPSMPSFDIIEYDPLLDSSDMGLLQWNQVANDIATFYEQYDGFVIFHGTDTMAYTASALSFMLENLTKPVILTGSQIPLAEFRNDALDNIITSLWLCSNQPIHEVCIYFNQKLLRGNRTQKVSAQRFAAFHSPNYPHLASIGIEINMRKEALLPSPRSPFHLQKLLPNRIANFRLFPGFDTDVLRYLLNQPVKGLVLETYGAGNAPNDPQLIEILTAASARGVVIVNCTQCQHGKVEMDQYATGSHLKKAGLVSGQDMTPEAAHCKLLYLFSKSLDTASVKEFMEKNLCGELTEL